MAAQDTPRTGRVPCDLQRAAFGQLTQLRTVHKNPLSWAADPGVMKRLIPILLLAAAPFLATAPVRAEIPLPMDEAFRLDVAPAPDGGAELNRDIAPGYYYLYRDFTNATQPDGTTVRLDMPPGTAKADENFGAVEVYFDSLALRLPATEGDVALTYQGCWPAPMR